ncbi:hypothetical protein DAEQUDRAFT_334477 [Daedalea quercina L-15889]|uniref:Uncharacterized protein n=1 Tax=Daedalea quercina L-15889 TaxID=1314783 RepID=A0A165PNE4_9APHY|nr:hypothetical protein DAEQUDRAFT_334477 [Daedalea quercina L-15889]
MLMSTAGANAAAARPGTSVLLAPSESPPPTHTAGVLPWRSWPSCFDPAGVEDLRSLCVRLGEVTRGCYALRAAQHFFDFDHDDRRLFCPHRLPLGSAMLGRDAWTPKRSLPSTPIRTRGAIPASFLALRRVVRSSRAWAPVTRSRTHVGRVRIV